MQVADREHIVRRLESFSDIVIAFGLAEIAFNLVMPVHAAMFVTHPVGIFAFIVTFAVVASFWSTHSAIFRNYFVANKVMIFINFVALAAVVLQVFALQLWLHFRENAVDTMDAGRIYFGIFSITFGAIALLSAAGTFYRWAELTPELRRTGVARSIRIGCTALGAALGTANATGNAGNVTFALWEQGKNERLGAAPAQIFLGLLLGFVIGRIAAAIVTRLMAKKAAAT